MIYATEMLHYLKKFDLYHAKLLELDIHIYNRTRDGLCTKKYNYSINNYIDDLCLESQEKFRDTAMQYREYAEDINGLKYYGRIVSHNKKEEECYPYK